MGLFDSFFGSHSDNGEKYFQKFLTDVEAENYQSAMNALINAASKKHPEAMAYMGKFYFDGEILPKDYNKAFNYSLQAANAGSVMGMYQVGHAYGMGNGTAKDIDKALYYWKKAADAGHENAQFMYDFTIYLEQELYMTAMDMFEGRNGQPKNVPEAIRIWEKCINTFDHSTSLYFMGHAEIVGAPPYLPQNIQAGVAKFVKAAKMGETEAFFYLMQMFREGKAYEGVPFEKNEALAGTYAVEVAEAIDPSVEELGPIASSYGAAAWAYLYGHGVPVNYAKAREYMDKVSPYIKHFYSDIDNELKRLGY